MNLIWIDKSSRSFYLPSFIEICQLVFDITSCITLSKYKHFLNMSLIVDISLPQFEHHYRLNYSAVTQAQVAKWPSINQETGGQTRSHLLYGEQTSLDSSLTLI